ncbi:MAG TPA: hypothetical protein VGL89_15030 [Candidatus Koribacter sp.]|jgi:hypothetical protein
MELLVKIVKISALVMLIFVLAVLCAPTLRGPFVIIHFATTLKAWLLVQVLFLGFVLAAHEALGRVVSRKMALRVPVPILRGFTPALEPLRC